MSKTLRRILILAGIFAAAAAIIWLAQGSGEQEKPSYTVLGNATLPTVNTFYEGTAINTLYGYTSAVKRGQVQESLTPLASDRVLPIRIDTCGNTITGISYEVRSITGDNLIEKEALDKWDMVGGRITASLPIKDLIKTGEEYSLKIELATEHSAGIGYYTRIVRSEGYHSKEMLEYVTDFHRSEFDAEKAAKYAINWEPKQGADTRTLAHVDIHSAFNQLTFKDLDPVEVGEPDITILDMDPYFGSFRIRYEVETRNNLDQAAPYFCEEFICLQWAPQRFYLMDYERDMSEYFSPSNSSITEKRLYFGINDKDSIAEVISPSGYRAAFSYNGNLWSYNREDMSAVQIFSYTQGQDEARRLCRSNGIKIIDISDEGDTEFFVYGYASRGIHEGECGIAYYIYNSAENSLEEKLYITTDCGSDQIAKDIDTLCAKHEGRIYFLFDDTVYSINETGDDIVHIVEGARAHQFVTNPGQSAIAWASGDEASSNTQVQVMNIDTGVGYLKSAEPGTYLRPYGFVDKDLVIASGRISDICISGLERLMPHNKLCVYAADGSVAATYEKAGIAITDVYVGDKQITLVRSRKEGTEYFSIEDDVLMQNNAGDSKKQERFITEDADKKGRVTYQEFPAQRSGQHYSQMAPEKVSYYQGSAVSSADDTAVTYYAYASGRLCGRYEHAGQAINAVTDDMGYVVDSLGRRIWRRSAKVTGSSSLIMPADAGTFSEEEEAAGCMDAFLKYFGVNEPVKELLESCSAEEIVADKLEGAVKLSGAKLSQLLTYVKSGRPILVFTAEHKTYLVIGYDSNNVLLYDAAKRSASKMSKDKADDMCAAGGAQMITCIAR